MSGDVRAKMRDIARAAVRVELSQVAIGLFQRKGFAKVTINDVAAAAGVSRSTFLRYFDTKEDAVLGAFDAQGQQVADALRARPTDEDDWTALHRALDTVVEDYRRDPDSTIAMARLVLETPALRVRRLEKQYSWRLLLAQALAERSAPLQHLPLPLPLPLPLLVRAPAALDCLEIAVDQWAASDGHLNLGDLIDQAFAALAAL